MKSKNKIIKKNKVSFYFILQIYFINVIENRTSVVCWVKHEKTHFFITDFFRNYLNTLDFVANSSVFLWKLNMLFTNFKLLALNLILASFVQVKANFDHSLCPLRTVSNDDSKIEAWRAQVFQHELWINNEAILKFRMKLSDVMVMKQKSTM